MHCLHVLALCLEEFFKRCEVLQFFSGFDDQIMDSESMLNCNKSSLIEVQVLVEDGHNSDASYLCIAELIDGVISEIPKEDIIALVLVIRLWKVNRLCELDIDVVLWDQLSEVVSSDLCLL